jgi:hypothetical protein
MIRFGLSCLMLWGLIVLGAWSQDNAATSERLGTAIESLAQSRSSPFLVLTENKWADQLHRVWSAESSAIIMLERDFRYGYLKRRKTLQCNLEVFWLGDEAPPKSVRSLGTWKEVEDPDAVIPVYSLLPRSVP